MTKAEVGGMDRLFSVGLLVSRIFLSGIFLFSGAYKIVSFPQTMEMMARQGMHMPGMLLVLAILFEIFGGLSLLLGYYPRLGALGLAFYLLLVTITFHRNFSNPSQAIQFAKNMAIMGGLFAILSTGGGEFSLGSGKRSG